MSSITESEGNVSTQAIRQIEALAEQMAERWNRHDTRSYVELWIEDCTFVNVVGIDRRGRRELLAELEYLHNGRFRDTQIRIERQAVRLLSPDLAVANVWWHMTGDPGMPGYPTRDGERQGVFTHVVQHTTAGWRFVASQNTDRLPIPDPLETILAAREPAAVS
jgi:uncharacterized protein (TIGR02246 family)